MCSWFLVNPKCSPWFRFLGIFAFYRNCAFAHKRLYAFLLVRLHAHACALLAGLTTPSTSSAAVRSFINNPCVCWMGLWRSIAVYCGVVFVWPWSRWFLGDGSIINLQLIHGANLTFMATPWTGGEAGRDEKNQRKIVEKAREKSKEWGRVWSSRVER